MGSENSLARASGSYSRKTGSGIGEFTRSRFGLVFPEDRLWGRRIHSLALRARIPGGPVVGSGDSLARASGS